MMNITDPFLRKIIEDALRSGNTSLRDDLDPKPELRRRQAEPGPNAIAAMMSAGMGPGVPRETSQAPRARLSLAQRFGPIPFVNNEPMRKDKVARLGLRGLLAGFNSRAGIPGQDARGGGGGGAAGGKVEDPQLAELRRLKAQAEIDAIKALAGSRNARTTAIQNPEDEIDPFLDEKEAWWNSRTDANKALAEARRKPKPVGAGRKGGSGAKSAGSNRAQLSARFNAKVKEMTARVEAIGATNGWTPEEIKAAKARQVARLADEYSALLTGDNEVQETPEWNDAGRPAAQRYTKPVAKGKAGGEVNPSENPNLTPEQRAYWKKKGF